MVVAMPLCLSSLYQCSSSALPHTKCICQVADSVESTRRTVSQCGSAEESGWDIHLRIQKKNAWAHATNQNNNLSWNYENCNSTITFHEAAVGSWLYRLLLKKNHAISIKWGLHVGTALKLQKVQPSYPPHLCKVPQAPPRSPVAHSR